MRIVHWLLGLRGEQRAVASRLRGDERLLGCCEHEAFGPVLVADTLGDPRGWVTIVREDGERWCTRDGVVFHSRGRAVRVKGGQGGVGVSAHGALVRRRAQELARVR